TPGFCGVETSVPLLLSQVNAGVLSLNKYVERASEGPARKFNIYPQKGSLLPGTDADFTIVDMDKEKVLRAEDLHSKNKPTPYDGFKVKGVPVMTIVRGKVVMKDGEILGSPQGKMVKPSL
ncbi:MAG TPA: amidohydrolase family protein, partial [Firmicutes bacterium]|nr:amidohydrolase family protein [Bacillota bacterium]